VESRLSSNWPWVVIAIVLGIGAITLIAAATAPSNGYYGMMGSGAWGWGFLMLGIPAIILLVILLAVLGAYREPTVFHPAYVLQSANALDALELRYARGELSRDDYLRIRGDLTRPSQP